MIILIKCNLHNRFLSIIRTPASPSYLVQSAVYSISEPRGLATFEWEMKWRIVMKTKRYPRSGNCRVRDKQVDSVQHIDSGKNKFSVNSESERN
jgi:hypothetical protein